jgi:hypothetical protein
MSQNLTDLITKTLGVVQSAPVAYPAKASSVGWGPSRPTPLYQFSIDVSRPEYGTAYVTAADASDAFDNVTSADINWNNCGDVDWDSSTVEQVEDIPDNQDELDEWDDQYGTKYTYSGHPMCSECENELPHSQLTTDPDDANCWLCSECLPSTTATNE